MRVDHGWLAVVLLALLALCACDGKDLILGAGNGDDRGGSGSRDGGSRDAGTRDGGNGSESPPAPPANVTFVEPRLITELASEDASDDDPSLSADRLLLCFNSKRDGGQGKEDIWCTKRAEVTAPWGAPEPIAALNTGSRETGIAMALDGLSVWFSSDREGSSGGLDVYTSARESRAATWPAPVRVAELSSEDDDLVSSLDETGRTLLMARRKDDDDDYDVWSAQRTAAGGPWQPPQPVDAVNTGDEESDAFLVGTGLEMIFTRDGDLMLSRRASVTAAFDSGLPIESLNSDDDDRDAWADSTLSYVIFSSDRDGPHQLYEAERL